MNLELPPSFAQHFRGPKFGVAGCRKLTKVEGRPLIGTIIKPSIGMSPQQTADMVKVLCEAGIDFVKDDELMTNPPHSPFDERVDAIMRDQCPRRSHRQKGDVCLQRQRRTRRDAAALREDRKIRRHVRDDFLLNSVGMSGAKKICDNGALAIHGHRNGWGMLNRHPLLGIEFPAYQNPLAPRRRGSTPRQRHREQILGER